MILVPLLQFTLIGVPSLVYIWAAQKKQPTILFLLAIVLSVFGLLTIGSRLDNAPLPLVYLLLAILALKGVFRGYEATEYGLRKASGYAVVAGGLAGAVMAFLFRGVQSLLTNGFGAGAESQLPLMLAIFVLSSAIGPAIGEELCFRGVFQGELVHICRNIPLAVILASTLFTLSHVNRVMPVYHLSGVIGILYVLSIFSGGIVAGYFRHHSGLLPAMAWHYVFNVVVTLAPRFLP